MWLSGSNPNGPICDNNVIIIITQMELVWEHSKMAQPQVCNVLLTTIYFNNLILGQTERLKSLPYYVLHPPLIQAIVVGTDP